MVIVNLHQCLAQLNTEAKHKIVAKLHDLIPGDKRDLETLLFDKNNRIKILSNLSTVEKAHLHKLIKKYSVLIESNYIEEQSSFTEEKLALLLLLQKGVMYKLERKCHQQPYVIPLEFVEAYFELYFQEEEKQEMGRFSVKTYLFAIIELLAEVKERKIKSVLDLKVVKECLSESVRWDILLEFLTDQQLVFRDNKQLLIVHDRCQCFFEQSCNEIKKQVTLFLLFRIMKSPYCALFLFWGIFSKKNGISKGKLIEYGYENRELQEVLIQLQLLDIIDHDEDKVQATVEQKDDGANIQAMEVGVLEFLLPITAKPIAFWTFRRWGTIKHWDVMVQIALTLETVRFALKENASSEKLMDYINTYLRKEIVEKWYPTLVGWVEKGQPIVKKDGLTFYSLSEKLHKQFIDKHWSHWHETTVSGIVIEKKFEKEFEKLLQELSVTIRTKIIDGVSEQKLTIVIEKEFQQLESMLPELQRLPKQWFHMTAFEEKMMLRIIKQAIVLQLSIQIEKTNGVILKVFPVNVHNKNGCYEVLTKQNEVISLATIIKIAIVHPLQ